MKKQNLTILICSIIAGLIIMFAVYMRVHLLNEHSALNDDEKNDEFLKLALHFVTLLPALIGMALYKKDVGKMVTTGYITYLIVTGFCYYFLLHGSDALESGILMVVLAIPYSIALSIFALVRFFQQKR